MHKKNTAPWPSAHSLTASHLHSANRTCHTKSRKSYGSVSLCLPLSCYSFTDLIRRLEDTSLVIKQHYFQIYTNNTDVAGVAVMLKQWGGKRFESRWHYGLYLLKDAIFLSLSNSSSGNRSRERPPASKLPQTHHSPSSSHSGCNRLDLDGIAVK